MEPQAARGKAHRKGCTYWAHVFHTRWFRGRDIGCLQYWYIEEPPASMTCLWLLRTGQRPNLCNKSIWSYLQTEGWTIWVLSGRKQLREGLYMLCDSRRVKHIAARVRSEQTYWHVSGLKATLRYSWMFLSTPSLPWICLLPTWKPPSMVTHPNSWQSLRIVYTWSMTRAERSKRH